MSDTPTLVYLEADDEITTVVRRLRAADAGSRVIVVAPGRSRATSSAVALRLLRRAAEADEREVAVVGDPLTRSLAIEAGLDAYASVEDAKRADRQVPTVPAEPRHATIHVVRGPALADTAPTLASRPAAIDAETRPIPVLRPPEAPRPRVMRATTRRLAGPAPLLFGLGAVVVLAGVVGAAVLPAATIRIVPRAEPVGPVAYEITIADPTRTNGSVSETATVTATGTYPIETAATGTVVFYNFNLTAVTVPAGAFVAAGEQAFATIAEVVVPRGRLIFPSGQIQAGEQAIGVVAAAAGPDANVPAGAIDTVVDPGLDARLQGFPENGQRRVENLDPTGGGLIDAGTEFTQADVDAAVAALTAALEGAVSDALAGTEGAVVADGADPPTPVIDGLEGLVGTRDQQSAEISGTLAYDRLSADPDEVRAVAIDRFEGESSTLVPDGQELLADATTVELGATRRGGDRLVVSVTVRGRSAATIDRSEVLRRAVGRSAAEAETALAELGEASVNLWPGWVSTVPDAEWRIDVEQVVDESAPSPGGS